MCFIFLFYYLLWGFLFGYIMSLVEKKKKSIWKEAAAGNCDILKSQYVDTVKNRHDGDTPLHILAKRGKLEILEHPSVDKVFNSANKTPLHYLARISVVDVYINGELTHSERLSDTILYRYHRFDSGTSNTYVSMWKPIVYERGSIVSKKWFKNKYPWYDLGNREISEGIIDEIINASNAEKFIGF